MPNYVKTKTIEESLAKIDDVEKRLIELIEEVKHLKEELDAEKKDKQNRLSNAFSCLKSE
jgi:ribosomal protein S15P/S13E